MTSTTHTRWAKRTDAAHIVQLIKSLAAYENEPASSIKITETDILRDGFGGADNGIHNQSDELSRPRRFECLIAELSTQLVGFCLFFHNYSTWEGRSGLYVEDLFVEDAARGHGLGKMLMATLAGVAQARDCPRVDLLTLDWNPARTFYDRIAMGRMKDWQPYRLEGQAVAALARDAPDIGDNR